MPRTKVSELLAVDSVSSDDTIYVIHDGESRKASAALLVGSDDVRDALATADNPSDANPFITASAADTLIGNHAALVDGVHGLTTNISAALTAASSPSVSNPFLTSNTLPPTVLRNRIVCIGDSITAGYDGQMTDYPRWLSFLTGGYVLNAGVAGNTLAQVLARLTTDVIANRPGICVIMAGTNDIGDTDANITAAMKSITLALLNANIYPVWCTITTRSDYPARVAQIRRVNAWLAAHCQNYGVSLADQFTAFAQSDGTPKANYLTDGLHPTTIGGVALAETVNAVLPDVARRSVPWRFAGDAENLFANADFATDTDSDGVPDSWSAYGNDAPNTTWTLSDHPSDGQWWVVEKTATVSSKEGGGDIQVTLTAGATYRIAFDLEMALTFGASTAVAYLSHVGSAQVDFVINNPQITTSTGYRFWADFTVPTGATESQFTFYGVGTAAFTIKIGRVMLFKLASTL